MSREEAARGHIIVHSQALITAELEKAINEHIIPTDQKRCPGISHQSDLVSTSVGLYDQAHLHVNSRPASLNGTTTTFATLQTTKSTGILHHSSDAVAQKSHNFRIESNDDRGASSTCTHETNSVFSRNHGKSQDSIIKDDDDDHEDFVRIPRHGSHTSEVRYPPIMVTKRLDSMDSSHPTPTHGDHPYFAKHQAESIFLSRPLTRMNKDWQKVKRLRTDVWSLRSKVHEMRGIVHEKRASRQKADDTFFKHIRNARLGEEYTTELKAEQEGETLERLFMSCETARNECGPLEDEYESLENDLGIKEFALQQLEGRFYDNNHEPWHEAKEEAVIDVQSVLSMSDSASQISHTLHPLVSDYFSKLGDVDISRERLDDHLEEKEHLEEERTRRRPVGLDIAPQDQEWLENYETARLEIETQLEVEIREAEELRIQCLSMGLLDDDGEPTSFKQREQRTFYAEFEENDKRSGYVNYPTLLPQPSGLQINLQDSGSSYHPRQTRTSIDPRFRVDQWLLHQLRMSTLGVTMLAETFEAETGRALDSDHWQEHVLDQWFEDRAGGWKSPPRTASEANSGSSMPTVLQDKTAFDYPTPVISSSISNRAENDSTTSRERFGRRSRSQSQSSAHRDSFCLAVDDAYEVC